MSPYRDNLPIPQSAFMQSKGETLFLLGNGLSQMVYCDKSIPVKIFSFEEKFGLTMSFTKVDLVG